MVHSVPRQATTALPKGVYFDKVHDAGLDGHACNSCLMAVFSGLSGTGGCHRLCGGDRACRSGSFHPQVHLGIALPGSFGCIHAIPDESVFPCPRFYTRHGDLGSIRAFADHAQKIPNTGGSSSHCRESCGPDRSSTGPNEQELIMSGINGDKSRFHRERKQKIARRNRNRELLKSALGQPKPVVASSGSKPKAVSA